MLNMYTQKLLRGFGNLIPILAILSIVRWVVNLQGIILRSDDWFYYFNYAQIHFTAKILIRVAGKIEDN